MRIITISVILILSMIKCTSPDEAMYSSEINFDDDRWQRFMKPEFEIPVEKSENKYDIFFTLRYSDDFPHDNIPLHAILNTPAGEERIYEFTIKVRDDTGKDKGRKAADSKYYFLEALLWQDITLTHGTAHLSLEQIIPKFTTPGIKSAGIRIYEAD